MSTCCKIWHLKYFFCNLMTTAANVQGCRNREGLCPPGPPPLEIFSDRLTLSQPWGEGERIIQDYTSPLDFRPSYGHVLLLHTLTV